MTPTAFTVRTNSPKFVTITPCPTAAMHKQIRPAPVAAASSESSDDGCASAPKGKKRRLDHLSWEEKIQRKKLKNRVAAQTSRDRKKARMEEMEIELLELGQRTELLQNKCESLQCINDSLLDKNQKLDMELEQMRQQLIELQQHKEEIRKKGDEEERKSAAAGTCAGWLKPSVGLTVDTSRRTAAATETERPINGRSVEDYCALPTLQDMLLLDDDETFDPSKLEELAESLLADITADMETSDTACDAPAAEIAGGAERLPGPVVGTAAERLESGRHGVSDNCDRSSQKTNNNSNQSARSTRTRKAGGSLKRKRTQQQRQQQPAMHTTNDETFTIQNNKKATSLNDAVIETTTETTTTTTTTPDTVYGTYDAKTNSITIVMDDDVVGVNEAVEEIYSDGDEPNANTASHVAGIKCPTPTMASPSQGYLNVDECTDDERDDELHFDPIARFLCPKTPLVSSLAKSPALSLHSAISDHGYESMRGSPTTTAAACSPAQSLATTLTTMTSTASCMDDDDDCSLEHFDVGSLDDEFAWNDSFNELFPNLL